MQSIGRLVPNNMHRVFLDRTTWYFIGTGTEKDLPTLCLPMVG